MVQAPFLIIVLVDHGLQVVRLTGNGRLLLEQAAVNGRSDLRISQVIWIIRWGEILIDDISVIENPETGSAEELIQNGDFSSGNANFGGCVERRGILK